MHSQPRPSSPEYYAAHGSVRPPTQPESQGFVHSAGPLVVGSLGSLFGFVFLNALRVLARWFRDVSFQAFFDKYDLRSECGPFWCPKLLFGRPDASIWGPTILAAWRHSGGPKEQQKGHLGVPSHILIGFTLISGLHVGSFPALGSNILFPFLSESGRVELEKQSFGVRRCAKTDFFAGVGNLLILN